MALITSPDGHVVVRFGIGDRGEEIGCPFYSIGYRGRPVVQGSRLGLVLAGAADLRRHLQILEVSHSEEDSSWMPLYGERHQIPNNYRQMTVVLRETVSPHRQLELIFRAYNEGAAFRYAIPSQGSIDEVTVWREATEFCFPPGCLAYEEHGHEGEYFRKPLEQITPNCERPLTIEYPDGRFACLVEAASFEYPRMLLSPHPKLPATLVPALGGPVCSKLPFASPWRALVVGDRPGDLLERNYLVLNLVPPCRLAETSWIKPGKAIREVTLSTRGAKDCVGFAVSHNLQYIAFDTGWYGPEYRDDSDATKVWVDPAKRRPEWGGLDLAEVVRYARERGIGVFLYVNRVALERQMDELFPLFEKWGIAGVKFGFVQVGPKEWSDWLHEAVRKAAKHRLLVDIHDAYRPSGFSRLYPNLLTQEGVRGNEHMPTARHNATLPFTRCVAGAADYTICYYSNRIQTTHAHQLALAVVIYSPLQFVFWYDRPSAYQGEPEVEFFAHVPTVWDDTRVLQGAIGEYAVIARRKDDIWFVGSITNEEARTLQIPLSFLDATENYVAYVYSDTPVAPDNRTGVKVESYEVDASGAISAELAPSGGQAMRLVPIDGE